MESIFESYYPWVVTMTAPLETGRDAAWVSLDLSFSSISSYINDVGIGQRGYCFLMDGDGTIVYHPQQRLLYAGLKSEDTSGLAALADGTYADDTVIYSLSSVQGGACGWWASAMWDELVNQNMRAMLRLSVAMAAGDPGGGPADQLAPLPAAGPPLRGLAAAMERFERDADRFAYRPVGGTREVRELSNSFGHMVVRIQRLMSTVREEEVNLRKTELKALQAQINPHFLYNTLDSIAWMCEQGRSAEAVSMVHALARLFRISISKGHELIPIAKEIEHAESYLQNSEVPLQKPLYL